MYCDTLDGIAIIVVIDVVMSAQRGKCLPLVDFKQQTSWRQLVVF